MGSCEFSGISNRESYMEIPLNSRCAREQGAWKNLSPRCYPRVRTRVSLPSAGSAARSQEDPSECCNVQSYHLSTNAIGLVDYRPISEALNPIHTTGGEDGSLPHRPLRQR